MAKEKGVKLAVCHENLNNSNRKIEDEESETLNEVSKSLYLNSISNINVHIPLI